MIYVGEGLGITNFEGHGLVIMSKGHLFAERRTFQLLRRHPRLMPVGVRNRSVRQVQVILEFWSKAGDLVLSKWREALVDDAPRLAKAKHSFHSPGKHTLEDRLFHGASLCWPLKDKETPLRVVIAFTSPFGLAMVLLGREPAPEVEAVLLYSRIGDQEGSWSLVIVSRINALKKNHIFKLSNIGWKCWGGRARYSFGNNGFASVIDELWTLLSIDFRILDAFLSR
ncbi:hypothetical protein Tco_0072147 [Tanacetum coccineum]